MPIKPSVKNASIYQIVLTQFGEMEDDDLKIAFDNIVEENFYMQRISNS